MKKQGSSIGPTSDENHLTQSHDWQVRLYSPSFAIDPGTTALLIIDMQYASGCRDTGLGHLLREKGLEEAGRHRFDRIEQTVIPNIKKLLDYFRRSNLRVIYVTIGSQLPDYTDVPEHLREVMQDLNNCEGNREHEILDELRPRSGELVINKVTQSAFNSSNIERILHNMDIQCLVLTGLSTSQCVETTARDASDLGFRCVLVEDCCAEDTEDQHNATLDQFARLFGRVTSSDRVLSELEDALAQTVP